MGEITDEAALRARYGEVHPRAAVKEIDRLDDICRRWFALSPFILIATSDGARQDVSPKGDAPGFCHVADEKTLLIPDWPGNNRLDGLSNILRRPAVGIISMIPGFQETLRVNGRATIHDDEALRARFETRGKLPITVTSVAVEEVFMHCAKAFMRSKLWAPETWPERSELPTMGEIIKAHGQTEDPAMTPEVERARAEAALY